MHRLTELLIAEHADPLVPCVDRNGAPVWPIAVREMRDDLAEMAAIFGASVVEVPCTEGGARVERGAVAALSASALPHARLYAHLTRRRVIAWEARDTSRPPPDLEVVVGFWSDATPSLMSALYRDPEVRGVGLVAAWGHDALVRAVLLRSAAAALAPRRALLPSLVFPEVKSPSSARRRSLTGMATPDEIRIALREPASVLVIASHSDGIDAYLGPLILCTTDRTDASETRRPTCIDAGHCHRLDLELAAAHASGRLLYPDVLTARVLVFGICTGVLLQPAMLDPRWSLGDRLMQSPRIGAVLTHWQVIFLEPEELQQVAEDLARGIACGVALASHNARLQTAERKNELCLLGDPRVFATVEVSALPRFPVALRSSRGDVDTAEIAFLKHVIISIARPGNLEVCQTATRLLSRMEQVAWIAGAGEISWNADVSSAVVSAMLSCETQLAQSSIRLAADARGLQDVERCFVCDATVDVMKLCFRAKGFYRETVICPLCGIIEDRPHRTGARLTVRSKGGRTLALSRRLAEGSAAGAVLGTRGAHEKCRLFWEPGSQTLELPANLPTSLFFITIVVVENGSLRIFRLPARGHAEP